MGSWSFTILNKKKSSSAVYLMGFLIVPSKIKSKEAHVLIVLTYKCPSLLLQIPNRLLRKQEAFFSRATRSHAANFSDI